MLPAMSSSARRLARASASAAVLLALLTSAAAAEDRAISIVGRAYDPAELTAAQGDTVVWTNTDAEAHTVTADDGAFDSDRLAPEEGFGHLFEAAGIFAYHCTVHADMAGVVVVTQVLASPTQPESVPPAGTLPPGFGSPSPGTDDGGGVGGLASVGVLVIGIAVVVVAIAVAVQVMARRQRRSP
jgi:plastocyanin